MIVAPDIFYETLCRILRGLQGGMKVYLSRGLSSLIRLKSISCKAIDVIFAPFESGKAVSGREHGLNFICDAVHAERFLDKAEQALLRWKTCFPGSGVA